MAAYSKRHYGEREWRLERPEGDRPSLHRHRQLRRSVWSTFDSNAPNLGESPGVCSHYVIEQDGTIDELVPPRIRCRHTIGLNHASIGIEMVQATGRGLALGRPADPRAPPAGRRGAAARALAPGPLRDRHRRGDRPLDGQRRPATSRISRGGPTTTPTGSSATCKEFRQRLQALGTGRAPRLDRGSLPAMRAKPHVTASCRCEATAVAQHGVVSTGDQLLAGRARLPRDLPRSRRPGARVQRAHRTIPRRFPVAGAAVGDRDGRLHLSPRPPGEARRQRSRPRARAARLAGNAD